MKSILLVEDDKSLNRGISFKLNKEGYKVFSSRTIDEAKIILAENSIDLMLLDVGLPDGNGFDFCGEIRKKNDLLIIFLTACDQEIDIVTGLDMGADDYIAKPFSLMVLMSKINALLRRNSNKNQSKKIVSGDIVFSITDMKVLKNEEKLFLSRTEIKLLKYLMDNAGQIITKGQLLNKLWDIDNTFVDENTIAVNIRRLREKIEDNPSKPKYIKNIRGMGYIWTEGCVKI
ncbi:MULTISPECIES: response regulator transcription factor [Clostridium]|uniref:Stage 0 sporulation protein A homolog n=1 Tax=Clostridium ragsdalei P11 TaxID=1353534 RepID=A0A1A6AMR0_9CLOT|nr:MULTISPECIES: response regulator transcription factor [Clostridium]OBR91357.1 transcriptional regulatory protein YycF [Clostridium ragsdalei P11]QXE19373.1 DNA-binding response regulator [Clostridium sp. 001]